MGVDFYNCHLCGAIYPDCGPCGSCEGCGTSWCGECDEEMDVFWFNGDIMCDICYNREPRKLTDAELIDILLKKLGTTREDIESKTQTKDPDVYDCQVCAPGDPCHADCPDISKGYHEPELEGYMTDLVRGKCCVSRGTECRARKKAKTE